MKNEPMSYSTRHRQSTGRTVQWRGQIPQDDPEFAKRLAQKALEDVERHQATLAKFQGTRPQAYLDLVQRDLRSAQQMVRYYQQKGALPQEVRA